MSNGLHESAYSESGKGKWDVVSKVLGPIDLHYHFRTKPLFRFLARHPKNQPLHVLEYGCGPGANLIDLKSRFRGMTGVGLDISNAYIDEATTAAQKAGCDGLKFVCSESPEALGNLRAQFDYILLIDVLEHLDRPGDVLSQLGVMLKPGGSFLISVPTYRYPQVFGRAFHEAVGHVRDGFNLEELDVLVGPSYDRTETSYNTGLLASFGCTLFYRVLPKIRMRKIAILGTIGLHVFRLVDWINGKSISSSLWSVYQSRSADNDRPAA